MIFHPDSLAPQVSIIVVGLRDAPLLPRCLASIEEASIGVSYEIIVVLNDPTPSLSKALSEVVGRVDVTTFRANLGFGRAVNFAASRARGKFLVLLNDDAVVTAGWLPALLDTAERRPRAGIVGGTTLHPDGTVQEAGSVLWSDGSSAAVGDGELYSSMRFERRVDYCSGCSLLIQKRVWDQLGGFDDSFYPAYYEDVDLCLRAAQLGWEVWYQPDSIALHERSATTNRLLLEFLFRRGKETFINRWSKLLEGLESPGNIEAAVWKAMGHPLRVLVIDDRIPVASLGSGFGRMFDALTVMAADPSLHVAFYGNLDEGVPTLDFPVPGVRRVASLQEHLNTPGVSYEVVIISRPHNAHQYMDYVNTALPGAAVIYDAEALFHRRLESQALFVEDEAERSALMAEAAETKRVEASSVSKADRVVCISRYEADVIEDLTGHPAEVVEPWLLAPNPTPARFREREHIGFVAGWAGGPGGPNSDALLWLAEQVLPRVRAALPNCRLRVTGGDPPSDVAWLAGQGVEFVGAVPDLSEFYNRIRVAVSPTRFGSGVKLKTIEGLQYGVPMVCTSEGAAGLPGRVARTVWITDDPSHFATALISLVSDEAAWRRQREAGLSLATPELITEFGVGRWPAIIHDAAYLKAHSKEDDDREPAELGAQP